MRLKKKSELKNEGHVNDLENERDLGMSIKRKESREQKFRRQ